jgi:hypothetical protein
VFFTKIILWAAFIPSLRYDGFYEGSGFMQKSILEEFARGNINPNAGAIPKGSQYDLAMRTLSDCENKLMSALDDKLQEVLKQLTDAQAEANLITNTDKFIYGYRSGVLMTMEVFTGGSDSIFGRGIDAMDKSIIRQLFFGEVYPSENVGSDCPELQKIHLVIAEEKGKFLQNLSEADREHFNRLEDLQNESAGIYSYECFAHGFKLANMLLVESLGSKVLLGRNSEN